MEAQRKKGGHDSTMKDTKTKSMRSTGMGGSRVIATTRKLMEAPQRLLEEEDINELMEHEGMCQKCRDHCDGFVHLTCGRGAQNCNQDIEINELIGEINHTDILDLLIVEKGSTAKMMMMTLKLDEPVEIMYSRNHLIELLKDLETDYYERYEFNDL